MNYILHLLIYMEIYILVAVSLNLLVGYGGLLQVAHAAYYGVGAYTAALLSLKFGYGFLPAALIASLVAGFLSLMVSLPAWRFKGDAFVMISLAVQMAFYALFYNWIDLTGGPFGVASIPKPAIGNSKFATHSSIFIIIIGVLKQSAFGISLQAMRDDDLAARSLGIRTRKLKIQTFFIASSVVGLAGSLFASYSTYIDPTSFTLDESILMLSMVIVGGTGNLKGPLVGALTIIAIPEILRLLELPSSIAANVRYLVYGLLLVLLMLWRPQGIAGRYRFE